MANKPLEDTAISPYRLQQLTRLIRDGREALFYTWPEWKSLRLNVLDLDHYECQLCKAKGRFHPARIVHHARHLRDRPDLALTVWVDGERQLVSVCKRCHEEQHPESQRQFLPAYPPLTLERWD